MSKISKILISSIESEKNKNSGKKVPTTKRLNATNKKTATSVVKKPKATTKAAPKISKEKHYYADMFEQLKNKVQTPNSLSKPLNTNNHYDVNKFKEQFVSTISNYTNYFNKFSLELIATQHKYWSNLINFGKEWILNNSKKNR
jgi:hypothetical protein